MRQANVIPTPFPGLVVSAHATDASCGSDRCPFEYRVRITNPTARDANVEGCRLHGHRTNFSFQQVDGVRVPPHTTRTVRSVGTLPFSRASEFVGDHVTCTGLDRHGTPSI
jgi:hypothetical protein